MADDASLPPATTAPDRSGMKAKSCSVVETHMPTGTTTTGQPMDTTAATSWAQESNKKWGAAGVSSIVKSAPCPGK